MGILNPLLRRLARSFSKGKLGYKAGLFAIKYTRGTLIGRDHFGNRLLLDMNSFLDSYVYVHGGYESKNIRHMQRLIQQRRCTDFVDVGANIGLYCLPIGRLPQVQAVHAFEPDPRNYAQLLGNLFLNDLLAKVHVHHCALSDMSGEADFFPSRFSARGDAGLMNAGTSSLEFDPERHRPTDRLRTPVHKGDDVLLFQDRELAIKIDVEGHELAVLRGMLRILRETVVLSWWKSWMVHPLLPNSWQAWDIRRRIRRRKVPTSVSKTADVSAGT